ncbi:MAG: elongator complex protein 3 [Candidatus Woesearchaeota archaeon]|jgi:elongator complex protein 3
MSDTEYFKRLIEWTKVAKPNKKELHQQKIILCKELKRKHIPTDIEIFLNTDTKDIEELRPYLTTKPARTSSGIAVMATMSMPSVCPHGACIFCPGGIGSPYGDVPMSYTGTEPSTMRGIRNDFDPYRIIFNRLQQYIILGQNPDKVDQIIMGGTFPSFPKEYQEQYVNFSFKAYNDFSREFYVNGELDLDKLKTFFELPGKMGDPTRNKNIKEKTLRLKEQNIRTLEEEQVENETTAIRCIGLTIETKPDWGRTDHALEFLRLGATRVELGVQTIYDEILQSVNRGHSDEETRECIGELRDLAFKLNFHIMPGLPTPDHSRISRERDIASMRAMFEDPAYKPDMVKIYPCMVMPGTPLEKIYNEGHFVPLNLEEAADIIVESFRYIPEWCRIMRVQRDIPTKSTTAGVGRTNLRQYVDELAKERGVVCRDIRAREVRNSVITQVPKLVTREYDAANGKEYFISSEANDKLLGFVRMRFCNRSLHDAITPKSALIRELHVYGVAVAIGEHDATRTQHKGVGKALMAEAEKIAREQNRDKIVVISGVGVRGYYRKIGYEREGPYMVKSL